MTCSGSQPKIGPSVTALGGSRNRCAAIRIARASSRLWSGPRHLRCLDGLRPASLWSRRKLRCLEGFPLRSSRLGSVMNVPDNPNAWAVDEICHRPAGAAHRGPQAGARPGPLHRRRQPARPGLCGDRAQPPRPRHHPRHRHRGRARRCPACSRLYRRRSRAAATARSNASMPFKNRDGIADEEAAAPRARRPTRCASSAIRSRAWWRRRCCRPRTPPRRSSVDIEPLPAVTNPQRSRAGPARRSSTTTCPATSRSTVTYGDTAQGRGGLREGRARRAGCSCATAASSSTRWSRARRSASYDKASGRFTLHVGRQGAFGMKGQLARRAQASTPTRCACSPAMSAARSA